MPTKQKRAKRETKEAEPKRWMDMETGEEDILSHWVQFNRFNTAIPRTLRLSESNAYFLECLAVQLNVSPSRILQEILDTTFPKFLEEPGPDEIELVRYYWTMKRAGVLRKADLGELKT